jgi:hypothetical protein
VEVKGLPSSFTVTVATRSTLPGHTLDGYTVRAILYGPGDIPLEQQEAGLPRLAPGARSTLKLSFNEKMALRVRFDVLRPTGFSAYTVDWTA